MPASPRQAIRELKKQVSRGARSAAAMITSILDEEWPADEPIVNSGLGFLVTSFNSELSAPEREIFRQALLRLLKDFSITGDQWPNERLPDLLYLISATSTPIREPEILYVHLISSVEYCIKLGAGYEGFASQLLGVLADARMITDTMTWRSYHKKVGPDATAACFLGMAEADLAAAIAWLDATAVDSLLCELSAGAIPELIARHGTQRVLREVAMLCPDSPAGVAIVTTVAEELGLPVDVALADIALKREVFKLVSKADTVELAQWVRDGALPTGRALDVGAKTLPTLWAEFIQAEYEAEMTDLERMLAFEPLLLLAEDEPGYYPPVLDEVFAEMAR